MECWVAAGVLFSAPGSMLSTGGGGGEYTKHNRKQQFHKEQIKYNSGRTWKKIPAIPELRKRRQEDHKFESSSSFIIRPWLQMGFLSPVSNSPQSCSLHAYSRWKYVSSFLQAFLFSLCTCLSHSLFLGLNLGPEQQKAAYLWRRNLSSLKHTGLGI